MLASKKVTRSEKRRVGAYIPLFLAAGRYFGFLFQKFTAVSILIQDRGDRDRGGWSFPGGWDAMVSPLEGVLAAPLIASLWKKLGARQPRAGGKFVIGMIQVSVCFFFLLRSSALEYQEAVTVLLRLLYTVNLGSYENSDGNIGLALATQSAPHAINAQTVAVKF